MVYPTGQAWTTPNETGSCAVTEGNSFSLDRPGLLQHPPAPGPLFARDPRRHRDHPLDHEGGLRRLRRERQGAGRARRKADRGRLALRVLRPLPGPEPQSDRAELDGDSVHAVPQFRTLNPNTTPPCTSLDPSGPGAVLEPCRWRHLSGSLTKTRARRARAPVGRRDRELRRRAPRAPGDPRRRHGREHASADRRSPSAR